MIRSLCCIVILCAIGIQGKSFKNSPDNDGLMDFDLKITHEKNDLNVDIRTVHTDLINEAVHAENSIESEEQEANYFRNRETPGLSITIDESGHGAWNYESEHEWMEKFPECGGIRQSPIDIETSDVKQLKNAQCLKWENYKNNQRFLTLKNPGHTIEASCTWESSEVPILHGGILSSSYKFAALHWHWGLENDEGSDHTVDGKASPLEMHLVHYDNKYNSLAEAIASHDSEALTVVGILFEHSPISNPGMFLLVKSMLEASTNGTQNKILPLASLGLNFDDGYYTYLGSLTTPPCTEIVRWIVLKEKLHISSAQLEVFRNVLVNEKPLYNNFRNVQPINKRVITDVSKCVS